MNKKAQGLSLNTIIIAIIVLIVLVVLVMIFTGYFGTRFTPAVTQCETSGGTCAPAEGCGTDAFGNEVAIISNARCPVEGQLCCSKGLGSGGETLCGGFVCLSDSDCIDNHCVPRPASGTGVSGAGAGACAQGDCMPSADCVGTNTGISCSSGVITGICCVI